MPSTMRTSDADGRFALRTARGRGVPGDRERPAARPAPASDKATLAPGSTTSLLDLALRPGARISGKIMRGKEPLPGASIQAEPVGIDWECRSGKSHVASIGGAIENGSARATTDAQGAMRSTASGPNACTVAAQINRRCAALRTAVARAGTHRDRSPPTTSTSPCPARSCTWT
jgi:hypothetical protein